MGRYDMGTQVSTSLAGSTDTGASEHAPDFILTHADPAPLADANPSAGRVSDQCG